MKGVPARWRRAHEAAFYFHDRIVLAMREVHRLGPRIVEVRGPRPANISAEQLLSMDGISLARALGENEKAKKLLLGEVTLALIADALHYICESLYSYEKGKLSVSLSLLRKPMKENLLHLEWIVADDEEFLSAFSSAERKNLSIETITPEQRKRIIRTAIQKTQAAAFEDEEFLFNLRYNKQFNGLEPLWQKAQHLTTTHQSVLTEPENFNFIFANPIQTSKIYDFVAPLYLSLTIHFYDMAGTALERLYPLHQGAREYDTMCKVAALSFANGKYGPVKAGFREVIDLCRTHLKCACGGKLEITPTTFSRALFAGEVYCGDCGGAGKFDLFELMGLDRRAA